MLLILNDKDNFLLLDGKNERVKVLYFDLPLSVENEEKLQSIANSKAVVGCCIFKTSYIMVFVYRKLLLKEFVKKANNISETNQVNEFNF